MLDSHWPWEVGCFSAQVRVDPDALAPRAGLLEPALAAVFCKTQKQARVLDKSSRKWTTDPSTGAPVNLVFEALNGARADQIQIFDNLAFDVATSTVSLLLPKPLLPEGCFACFFLMDVQQYRVISPALETSAFVETGVLLV
jgi:hypothetical protein